LNEKKNLNIRQNNHLKMSANNNNNSCYL